MIRIRSLSRLSFPFIQRTVLCRFKSSVSVPPPPASSHARFLGPNKASARAVAAQKAVEDGTVSEDAVTVVVDGAEVTVPPGSTVLDACKAAHKHVPTLCHHPQLYIIGPGNCRMCLVDVGGSRPVPACATEVTAGMTNITTHSPELDTFRKDNLKLILQRHPNECMTCEADGNCELQDLVYRYDVHDEWPKLTDKLQHAWDDTSSDSIARDMDKCISCGRCVTACSLVQEMDILSFLGRGDDAPLPGIGELLGDTPCISCGQCTLYCPVGALTPKPIERVLMQAIENKDRDGKIHVACTAPSVRVAIGEELGMEPGAVREGQMVAALRSLGFDYVFDTQFAADVCILEEGTELIHRLQNGGKLPLLTSCCPGWVNLVEQSMPELLPHLSSARSPQAQMSSLIKSFFITKLDPAHNITPEDVVVTSVMPCTAKKDEAARPQLATASGSPETDFVLTTRELGKMLRLAKVPYGSLPDSTFDSPMGDSSTAGALFGVTGGVMEAAVRYAHVVLTGKPLPRLTFDAVRGLSGVKQATVEVGGVSLRLAAVNGTGATKRTLQAMANGELHFDFVEVMACPGGCIGGGGQPKSHDPLVLQKRAQSVYDADERSVLRMSQDNPSVKRLYDEFLTDGPLGAKSHALLHTHYTDRSAAHNHTPVRQLLPSDEELEEA